jgi:hypothetical protein
MDFRSNSRQEVIRVEGDFVIPKGLTERDFKELLQKFLAENNFIFDGTAKFKD